MISNTHKLNDSSLLFVETHVLFLTGGMTNSHPGNRRFRDLIALHRPDYMNAQKTEKPVSAFP